MDSLSTSFRTQGVIESQLIASIPIGYGRYMTDIKLFTDGELSITMTETVTKMCYHITMSAKDIVERTRSAKMEQDSKEFFEILKTSFESYLDLPIDQRNSICRFTFTAEKNISFITYVKLHPAMVEREIEIELIDVKVPDVTRMGQMMHDLVDIKAEIESTIKKWRENDHDGQIESIKEEMKSRASQLKVTIQDQTIKRLQEDIKTLQDKVQRLTVSAPPTIASIITPDIFDPVVLRSPTANCGH